MLPSAAAAAAGSASAGLLVHAIVLHARCPLLLEAAVHLELRGGATFDPPSAASAAAAAAAEPPAGVESGVTAVSESSVASTAAAAPLADVNAPELLAPAAAAAPKRSALSSATDSLGVALVEPVVAQPTGHNDDKDDDIDSALPELPGVGPEHVRVAVASLEPYVQEAIAQAYRFPNAQIKYLIMLDKWAAAEPVGVGDI